MIDIRSIKEKGYRSKEDWLIAIYIAVDSNLEEVSTQLVNETKTELYNKFLVYKTDVEFMFYIGAIRNNETSKEFTSRMLQLRTLEDTLKFNVIDEIIENVLTAEEGESIVSHFLRFYAFESAINTDDIFDQRLSIESDQDYRNRVLGYITTKTSIEKSLDEEVTSEMERFNDDETLSDWKERATVVYNGYKHTLILPRRNSKNNNLEETFNEVFERVEVFTNLILEINKLVDEESLEKRFDDVKSKERYKIEAKQEVEAEGILLAQQQHQEIIDERVNRTKPFVFFLFFGVVGLVIVLVIFQYFGKAVAISTTGIGVLILGLWIKVSGFTKVKKGFNMMFNGLFIAFRHLNNFLNLVGLTDNRRF